MKKSTYKTATIITVILCLFTLGLAWTSDWFTNWNTAEWTKKWEQLFGNEQSKPNPTPPGDDTPTNPGTPKPPVDNDVVAISGKGDNMLAGKTYDMDNFAYVCSENSVNKTITLNATVEPENATDKNNIRWKVEWVNPNVGFANGKKVTDYITIKQDTTNPAICKVSYQQDFGSKIKVVAYIYTNPTVNAECTVDCVQKFIHFNADGAVPLFADFNGNTFPKNDTGSNGYNIFLAAYLMSVYNFEDYTPGKGGINVNPDDYKNKKIGFFYNQSIGTISNDITSAEITYALTPEFKQFIDSQGWTSEVSTYTISLNTKSNDIIYNYPEGNISYKTISTENTYVTMNDIYKKFFNVTSNNDLKAVYDWMKTEGNKAFTETIVFHNNFEDITFSDVINLDIYVDIPATNINIDQGNIKV